MTAWKQLSLCFFLLVAGLAAVVAFVPGAAGLLRGAGVPEAVVATIAPGKGDSGEKQDNAANGGERRRQNVPLVVTEPVVGGIVNDRLSAIGTGDAIRSCSEPSSRWCWRSDCCFRSPLAWAVWRCLPTL